MNRWLSFRNRKAVVLLYHRVVQPHIDPWQLAVTPGNFEDHLQVLKKKYNVISVEELLTHLGRGKLPTRTVCITFDDGYRDNILTAKPLLELYRCPAHFFIASHYVAHQQPFWIDVLGQVLFGKKVLPETLSLCINRETFKYSLKGSERLTAVDHQQLLQWTWPHQPPNTRAHLYLVLWERLKPLTYEKIQAVMQQLEQWANPVSPLPAQSGPMKEEELRHLAGHPLISIGMHTVTHPALSNHSKEVQGREILENRSYLERSTSQPMTTLAYPYGDYNEETLALAQELKIAGAFTTSEGSIIAGCHIHQLSRFQVKNWDKFSFEMRMTEWFQSRRL
jgi:peptidoglycan/xylan/chitin deacetylase (PgdA/CDA1 family)